MTTLRVRKKSFDLGVRRWFLLYLIAILLTPILLGVIPFPYKSFPLSFLLEITFEIIIFNLGIAQGIRVKRTVDWDYKILEINDTKKGIQIFTNKYLNPIYVPFSWLTIEKSDTESKYTLVFSRAIKFNKNDSTSILPAGKLILTDKNFDFNDVKLFINILEELENDTNAILKNSKQKKDYFKNEIVEPFNFKSVLFLPLICLIVSIPAAVGISDVDASLVNNEDLKIGTQARPRQKKKRDTVYHEKVDYHQGLVIKTKLWKFEMNHAYETTNDTGQKYIILNISVDSLKGDYAYLNNTDFSSYNGWSISKERNYEKLDGAENNLDFYAKVNGVDKPVMNILGMLPMDTTYSPHNFNIVLQAAKGDSTDIVYSGSDIDDVKGDDTSFVMKIKSNDLEQL